MPHLKPQSFARLLPALGASLALALPAPAQDNPFETMPPGMDGQVLWLSDTVPWIQKALRSDRIRALLESPELKSLLSLDELPSARELEAQFGAIEGYIPERILWGMPQQTVTDMLQVLRLAIGGMRAAVAEDEATTATHRPVIRAALANLGSMDMWLEVAMRDERVADQAFEAVADAMADAPPFLGAETSGDSVSLTINLGEVTRNALPPGTLLEFAGDEATEKDWMEILDGKTLKLRLTQQDNRLVLRIGDRALTGDGLALGKLWTPTEGATPIGYTRWAIDELAFAEFYDELFEFAMSDEIMSFPEEMGLAIDEAWTMFSETAVRGESLVTAGETVRVQMREEFLGEDAWAEELLGDSKLASLVPEDAASFELLAAYPLDALLSSALTQMDNNLAKQEARAWERNNAAQLETIEWLRYEAMAPIEEYIHGEDSAVFDTGAAWILDRGGPLGTVTGGGAKWTPEGARLPAIAFVGRPLDTASGEEFFARFAVGLHVLLGGDGQVEVTEDPNPLRDRAEPTPVHRLPLTGTKVMPNAVDVEGGDLGVHGFQRDGWLVVSTSRALSERIAARFDAEAEPLPAERATALFWGRSLRAKSSVLGKEAHALAQILKAPDGAARAALEAMGYDATSQANAAELLQVVAVMGVGLGAFDIEWGARREGDVILTGYEVR